MMSIYFDGYIMYVRFYIIVALDSYNIFFQVWLILTGKLDYPWKSNWYQFTDWYGNDIYVPTTSCFSLIFSVLAMMKAIIYFNIAIVHMGVSISGYKYIFCHSFKREI